MWVEFRELGLCAKCRPPRHLTVAEVLLGTSFCHELNAAAEGLPGCKKIEERKST